MNSLVSYLLSLPPLLVLAAAFLFPALEASALIGVVVPGETAVFVAGLVAHGGAVPLWAVIVVAVLGAVVGDQVGYLLGRRWGPGLVDRLPRRVRSGGGVNKALDLIRTRGAVAVFLGRWTALLRALVPGVAGSSGMRQRTFSVFNVLGGVTWAVTVAAVGFAAGAAYEQWLHSLGRASQIVLGVVVVCAVGFWAVQRRRRRHAVLSAGNQPLATTTPEEPTPAEG